VHASHQAVQDVRDWRRQEGQGRPLPVNGRLVIERFRGWVFSGRA
jgi:hypothetical protein